MFQTGLRAAAQRLPFLPMRAGLGSDVVNQPADLDRHQPVRRRRGAGRRPRAPPRCRPGAPQPRRRARQRAVPRAGPLLRRPVLHGGRRAPFLSVEQIVDTAELTRHPGPQLLLNRMMVDGVVETPNGAHFTTCTPDYERDERFQRAYAGRRRARGLGGVRGQLPVRRRGRLPAGGAQPRSDMTPTTGRPATPRGRDLRRRHRRRLRRRRRDLRQPDGLLPMLGVRLRAGHLQPRPGDLRRRVPLPGHAGRRQLRQGDRGLDPVPQGLRRLGVAAAT